MRYWEAPLVQKFFAVTRALERPIDAAFWELLILCGGRIGEVLGLRWSDVDWKNRTIHIQRTLLEIDGHIRGLQDNTKTEAGDRLVSLPDELMKLLETAHLKFRQEQQWPRKQQRPRPPELKEHMFLAESRGTPTFKRQSRVHREFSALCLKAGVPRIRIHDLRHTNATLLLSKGVDIKTVSTRLGHANVQVTLDLYAHVTQQMNEKAADALSEVLENEST